MEFSEVVLATVIGGVIVAALLALVRWLWVRRRRPLDWAATGKAAIERRQRRIAVADHQQLVEWVLQRAEVLGTLVPVAVDPGPSYDTVTFHPSGEQLRYPAPGVVFLDLVRAGMPFDRRTLAKTSIGRPVSEWRREDLRKWLSERKDHVPPEKDQT